MSTSLIPRSPTKEGLVPTLSVGTRDWGFDHEKVKIDLLYYTHLHVRTTIENNNDKVISRTEGFYER